MEYALCFSFKMTNNQAKYEALLTKLKLAKEPRATNLKIFTNSQLIASQVTSEYKARDLTMADYLSKLQSLTSMLKCFDIFHIPSVRTSVQMYFPN